MGRSLKAHCSDFSFRLWGGLRIPPPPTPTHYALISPWGKDAHANYTAVGSPEHWRMMSFSGHLGNHSWKDVGPWAQLGGEELIHKTWPTWLSFKNASCFDHFIRKNTPCFKINLVLILNTCNREVKKTEGSSYCWSLSSGALASLVWNRLFSELNLPPTFPQPEFTWAWPISLKVPKLRGLCWFS